MDMGESQWRNLTGPELRDELRYEHIFLRFFFLCAFKALFKICSELEGGSEVGTA